MEESLEKPELTRRLHLHLRAEYFDAIKAGTKTEEYRSCSNFYARQLEQAPFAGIVLYRGYPKADDTSRVIKRPWRGYSERIITHPQFGPRPIRVFVIPVN